MNFLTFGKRKAELVAHIVARLLFIIDVHTAGTAEAIQLEVVFSTYVRTDIPTPACRHVVDLHLWVGCLVGRFEIEIRFFPFQFLLLERQAIVIFCRDAVNTRFGIDEFHAIDEWNKWDVSKVNVPFERFWYALNPDDEPLPEFKNKEVFDYYINHRDTETNMIYTTLCSWGNLGKFIDFFVSSGGFKFVGRKYIKINKEFINKGLQWVDTELKYYSLKPVTIVGAGNGENIIACDTVEVEDNSGNLYRLNSNEAVVYIKPSAGVDYDKLLMLNSFRETLLMINDLDLENNFVWYYRK